MLEENKKYTPLVSIIIPCYNHEKYIVDSLEGILRQTYTNIELLICDDCSVDKTFEIIVQYEEKLKALYKSVGIYKNDKNLGVVKTINSLLRRARGEIIKIIASDDFMHANYVEEVVKIFDKNENVDAVITDGYYVEEDSCISNIINCKPIYEKKPDFSDENIFELIFKENFIFSPGMTMKKSLFLRYGLYDENIQIEDWEYNLRLTKDKNVNFYYLDKPLIYYRKNGNSMTSLVGTDLERRRKRLYEAEFQIIEKYKRFVDISIYINKRFEILFRELKIAKKNNLSKLYTQMRKEMKEVLKSKHISMKNRVLYIRYQIKCFLGLD